MFYLITIRVFTSPPCAMSDASLVNFLQSELLLLSNEIKKKYPEIKEVNKKNQRVFTVVILSMICLAVY